MAMTIIVEPTRAVTGGVDTHLDVHVAAVLDEIGGLLATESFEANQGGEHQLVGWLGSFGPLACVGVEGTGSYGAGLARLLAASGVDVVEVDRPNRQVRRRQGKTDTLDAIEAARAAQSGRATGRAKSRDGNVEAIRALVVAKRSARTTKTSSLNQIRHLGFTAPNPLRERLSGLTAARLAVEAASMRPRAGTDAVTFATKRRCAFSGAGSSRSMPNSSCSTPCSARWSRPPHPGSSSCMASASIPLHCYSSLPATTRNGCAAKPRGHTCAGCHQSKHHQAKSPATG